MTWEGMDEVLAIAEAGSFVGGAALLGSSTSHMSRAVARLEQRLGTSLFKRTTRKVTPTETGLAFIERCRRLVEEREELLSEVSGRSQAQGELMITCSVAMGERFVAPIVRRFTQANPHLRVTLDLTNRVVDVIGEGYDIGIRSRSVADPRLIGHQIASRSLELCASPNYLRRAGTPASVEELAAHECLVGSSPTWYFLEQGLPKLFSPTGRWRCNSGAAVVDAVLAGMGVCQLPNFYVHDHITSGRLAGLLKDVQAKPEAIWAAYPRRRHLLPKIRNFVEFLSRELPEKIYQAD